MEKKTTMSDIEVRCKSKGKGWHADKDPGGEGHRRAGKIGGSKVAEDRQHMAEIGKKGGSKSSSVPGHTAEIGKKGGIKSRKPATAK